MDEEFKKNISETLSFNKEDLKREHGDFQFTDVAREIDSLYQFVKDLSSNEDYYNYLPDNRQKELKNRIQRVWDIFSQVKNFRPVDIPNPQDTRNSYAEQMKNLFRDTFDFIENLDLYKIKSAGAQATLSNLTNEAKVTLKEAKEAKNEISGLLDAAKQTTGQVAVTEYLGIFSKASVKYRWISLGWLVFSIIAAFALFLLLLNTSKEIADSIGKLSSTQAIISLVITKLFFVAIVVYSLQQCIRNYMANMHQSILNEHRENSLKVFNSMIKSSSSKETTDQILSYLTKSIFDAGETGFFPGKDISKDGPDLIQIFKDVGKPS